MSEDAPPSPEPPSDPATVDGEPSAVVIECASSGRAKCRACGDKIPKDTLRFGERLPSPFTDKPTSYWFHLRCASLKRPRAFERAVLGHSAPIPDREQLLADAALGKQHPRLERIARQELAPSGRAKCRQCRAPIDKDSARFALDIWEEGRFAPIGYIHVTCARDYFGTELNPSRLTFANRPVGSTP
jgi:hypothetical protein